MVCMKDMASPSWQATYQNRVGGEQIISISRMLLSFAENKRKRGGFDQFIKIIDNLASMIIAVIFGNPVAMMAVIAGPGVYFRARL